MEIILGIIICWLIAMSYFVVKLFRATANHKKALYTFAYSMNVSALDLAMYVKMTLQEKARYQELTEDEKLFFSKSHEAIPRIEASLKALR